MADAMKFPKTPKEFIQQYSFKDKEEVYTNGSELIPVFRVEQMIEHYIPSEDKKETNADRIRSMSDEELTEFLNNIHEPDSDTLLICNKEFFAESEILDWLQKEVGE